MGLVKGKLEKACVLKEFNDFADYHLIPIDVENILYLYSDGRFMNNSVNCGLIHLERSFKEIERRDYFDTSITIDNIEKCALRTDLILVNDIWENIDKEGLLKLIKTVEDFKAKYILCVIPYQALTWLKRLKCNICNQDILGEKLIQLDSLDFLFSNYSALRHLLYANGKKGWTPRAKKELIDLYIRKKEKFKCSKCSSKNFSLGKIKSFNNFGETMDVYSDLNYNFPTHIAVLLKSTEKRWQ